jgi:hypothetical protein
MKDSALSRKKATIRIALKTRGLSNLTIVDLACL